MAFDKLAWVCAMTNIAQVAVFQVFKIYFMIHYHVKIALGICLTVASLEASRSSTARAARGITLPSYLPGTTL